MALKSPETESSGVRYWYASRTYRLTAVGLFVLGVGAGLLTVVVPSVDLRELLTAFAGVGLFGALLLFSFRPSATSDTDPVEQVYTAYAANAGALARDAELGERQIYAPTTYDSEDFTPVALTVPASDHERVSIDRNRQPVFGDDGPRDGSALTLYPTGGALFDAFGGMVVTDLSTDPVELAAQLGDGVVLGLELAEAVEPSVDAAAGRAAIDVTEPRFGSLDQFDHPVTSFLAVGFAASLDVAVTVEQEPDRIVCRWSPEGVADVEP
jgi:hypothetical protein